MDSAAAAARPLAILLMGPTASGKTDLAVELCGRLPCDIVSVDSALVYRGMDIGTAKPEPRLLAEAPHRLIDICDPNEVYSAARFCEDAAREMAEIAAAGRVPLLVGGTMLYFRALQQGLSRLPGADPVIRARLDEKASAEGWSALHRLLAEVDPATAGRIHPNDPQRIQRALEVYEIAGRPMSQLLREKREPPTLEYRFLKLAPTPESRPALHQRIERRFLRMLALGFEDEVRALWARGDLTRDMPSMRCVGYRQMLNYLCDEYSFDEMIRRGIAATRQLAKRQLTWLRSESDAHWLPDRGRLLDSALRLIHEQGI